MKTFKEWLTEAEHSRPYIKASQEFKDTLDSLKQLKDQQVYQEAKANIKKFSDQVGRDGKVPKNMYGHTLSQPLDGLSEVHIIFGNRSLIYVPYRGAILYIDIIAHKFLDNKAASSKIAPRLQAIAEKMKKYADSKFKDR